MTLAKIIKKFSFFMMSLVFLNPIFADTFSLDDMEYNLYTTRYNKLASVEDADRRLKSSDQFGPFLEDVGDLVTKYDLGSYIGLRLLHRHFPVSNLHVMGEEFMTVDEKPSLVTSNLLLDEAKKQGAIPASWMFSDETKQFSMFEASTDPAIRAGVQVLQQNPFFLEEMGEVLARYNFTDLFALAVLKREGLPTKDDEVFLEINGLRSNQSVVQVCPEAASRDGTIITSWSFRGPKQVACKGRCSVYYGGHKYVHTF